jgi:hypothetical protein
MLIADRSASRSCKLKARSNSGRPARLRIAYDRLDEPSSVAHRIAEAQTLAYSSNKPVALLLYRDLMWEP